MNKDREEKWGKVGHVGHWEEGEGKTSKKEKNSLKTGAKFWSHLCIYTWVINFLTYRKKYCWMIIPFGLGSARGPTVYIVGPWTTQVWMTQVHLHADFFSGMNTTVQRDSWLVESADAEPWIWRNLRYWESTTSSAYVPLCRGRAPLTPHWSRVDCIEIAVYPQIWGTIAYKHASLWYHLCVRKTGVFKLDTWCVNQETTCSKVKFIWNHQSKSIPKSVSTTKGEQSIGRMGFCHKSHTYESLHTSWASIFLNV